MTKHYAAFLPLVLAACAPPAVLPEPDALTLAVADPASATGAVPDLSYFPDYRPRVIDRPGDWRQLNRDRAPEGALE